MKRNKVIGVNHHEILRKKGQIYEERRRLAREHHELQEKDGCSFVPQVNLMRTSVSQSNFSK